MLLISPWPRSPLRYRMGSGRGGASALHQNACDQLRRDRTSLLQCTSTPLARSHAP